MPVTSMARTGWAARRDRPRPADLAGEDAVQFLTATLSAAAAAADPVDLLMVGPLTNLALALRRAPGIVGGIGQLTVMGGTLYGRGNVTPAAEFNIFCDPEAAAIVLGAGLDTTVVPWEPCARPFPRRAATSTACSKRPPTATTRPSCGP